MIELLHKILQLPFHKALSQLLKLTVLFAPGFLWLLRYNESLFAQLSEGSLSFLSFLLSLFFMACGIVCYWTTIAVSMLLVRPILRFWFRLRVNDAEESLRIQCAEGDPSKAWRSYCEDWDASNEAYWAEWHTIFAGALKRGIEFGASVGSLVALIFIACVFGFSWRLVLNDALPIAVLGVGMVSSAFAILHTAYRANTLPRQIVAVVAGALVVMMLLYSLRLVA